MILLICEMTNTTDVMTDNYYRKYKLNRNTIKIIDSSCN